METKETQYIGGTILGSGLQPAEEGAYPLVQAKDVWVSANKRLDVALKEISSGGSSDIDSALPIPVETEAKMVEILSNATGKNLGEIYKYMGEDTANFTQGMLYIITEDDAETVGISDVELYSSDDESDTYTITLTNGKTRKLRVKRDSSGGSGVGIVSIEKTATEGLVDTYTITFTDGTTSTFTVTNGKDGVFDDEALSDYQTKTDESLTTFIKTIPGAINELDGKAIDKIAKIDNGAPSIKDIYSSGISWEASTFLYDSEGNNLIYKHIPTDRYMPISAGDNITFTNEGNTVKISATGGGGSGEDGRGIVSIDLTSTVGRTKTYTITYTDNTTSTFTVMDGATGSQGAGLQIVTTSGTNKAYTAYVSSITSLTSGATFIMVPHSGSSLIGGTITLNVNSLGAKEIKRRYNNNANTYADAGTITSGKPYRVMYDGSYWILVDYPKLNANDLVNRVPVSNGGVPTTSATNAGKVLTVNESGTPEWQEPSSPSSDESMIGEWSFINGITLPTEPLTLQFSFSSNGFNWDSMEIWSEGIRYSNEYTTIQVYSIENDWFYTDPMYSYIQILEQPSVEASAWIKSNAEIIPVVGVEQIKNIDTYFDDMQSVSADEGGIYWTNMFGIGTRAGITPQGNIYQAVPIAAGEGIAFEVDEDNQVVKINATGGGSGGADNSMVGTWVFNEVITTFIDDIDTPEEFNDGAYDIRNNRLKAYFITDEGEKHEFTFFNCSRIRGDLEGYDYDTTQITDGYDIWFYENGAWISDARRTVTILEEPEAYVADWIRANATKQEETPSDTSSGMPQIRFVGMPCDGLFGRIDHDAIEQNIVGTWVFNDVISPISDCAIVSFSSNGYDFMALESNMNGILHYSEMRGDFTEPVYNPESDRWSDERYQTIEIHEESQDGEMLYQWLAENAQKLNPNITTHNLKFTIEIVSGEVQVGDAIQICRMCSYGNVPAKDGKKAKPKKKKLRRFVEYTITEEDLGKRFITFEVPYIEGYKLRKVLQLFTKTSTMLSPISSVYFRIRRPKGEINSGDGGGMTVDAEFSNVVPVSKVSVPESWYDPKINEYRNYYKIKLV